MKEIDWSKAPEGATHYLPETEDFYACWCKQGYTMRQEKWVPDEIESVRHLLVPRPHWTGDGLPPVGTVCIVKPHNTLWGFSSTAGHERTVLAYHGEFVWLGQGNMALETTRIDKVDFLPLRTPEQIAADEREKAVDEMMAVHEPWIATRRFCEKLYDAGYRRQEPKE